jgi:hypothetical protein
VTWRIEASGGTGSANLVVIQPVSDDDPNDPIRHAIIKVSPKGGRDHPTLPVFPLGFVYRDRIGMEYTIMGYSIVESGPDDGEHSIWSYEYLAAYTVTAKVESAS